MKRRPELAKPLAGKTVLLMKDGGQYSVDIKDAETELLNRGARVIKPDEVLDLDTVLKIVRDIQNLPVDALLVFAEPHTGNERSSDRENLRLILGAAKRKGIPVVAYAGRDVNEMDQEFTLPGVRWAKSGDGAVKIADILSLAIRNQNRSDDRER